MDLVGLVAGTRCQGQHRDRSQAVQDRSPVELRLEAHRYHLEGSVDLAARSPHRTLGHAAMGRYRRSGKTDVLGGSCVSYCATVGC